MLDTAETMVAEDGALPIKDHDGLRKSLLDANLPTLLMVYITFTQDEEYLERFSPYIRSIYSPEPTNIPEDLAEDLRQRLFDLLTATTPPKRKALDREFMRKMMSISVGEVVDPEFIPALHDQMGFEPSVPRKELPDRLHPPSDFQVVVIGAGMTGIAAGVKLGEAGYDYTIFEKNAEVGGTWWENVYPGVGVDTPSHFYSYSFELNPNWSHYHPKGPEIHRYLSGVADKYGIRKNIRFETRVTGAVWDEAAHVWHVSIQNKDGEATSVRANAVILAHGLLNRWSMPKIPGLETFKGPAMHTAGWDPRVDLKGKRIAVIGTGASAAQLAPAVAPTAEHVTVFQRSKHWVLNNPDINADVTPGVQFALREIPHYKEWFRFRVYWFTGDGLYGNVCQDDSWPDKSMSISAQNEGARQYALAYLNHKLADRPDLREKLTPDYPIFGKRIILDADGGWIDTLKRPNVTLETRGIDHIEEDAVVLKDGTRVAADVLALATGFDIAKIIGSLTIKGQGGRDLGAEWGDDNPRAYLGVVTPGYPNFFFTLGPNSAPNHAAGVNMVIECQINYIIESLDLMIAKGAKEIVPTEAACAAWNEKVERQMTKMIWTHPKARSYYLNSAGRNIISCPFRLVDYWTWMRHPDLEAFQIT